MVSTAHTDQPKRTAAGRVLSVLEAFSHGNGSLRLSDISRHADLPLPTAHRLVHELLDWGGLDVDGEGRYRLSRKFLDLASTSTNALQTRELAVPHMVDLHRRSGLTVLLGVKDDREVVYLDALRAHPNWSGENRIGGRLPLHVTATGLAILAHADQAEIDRYASRPLQRYTPYTPGTERELRELLDRSRRDRCCVAPKFMSLNAGSVAAPILDACGEAVAALGVVYVVERDNPVAIADLVRLFAARISTALSAQPAPPDPRTIDFKRRRAGFM